MCMGFILAPFNPRIKLNIGFIDLNCFLHITSSPPGLVPGAAPDQGTPHTESLRLLDIQKSAFLAPMVPKNAVID